MHATDRETQRPRREAYDSIEEDSIGVTHGNEKATQETEKYNLVTNSLFVTLFFNRILHCIYLQLCTNINY